MNIQTIEFIRPIKQTTAPQRWNVADVEALFKLPFADLLYRAQQVHREHFDPNAVQLSTLLSIKTGGCTEDCGYCPQSAFNSAGVEDRKMLEVEEVVAAARAAQQKGAGRFCMGAAWREPTEEDMASVVEMVRAVRDLGMETCATLGMLNDEQTEQLRAAGLDYYNHNLDTAPEFYGNIVSTRDYQDRLDTLERVRKAGMNICSGGIVGMGESLTQRAGLIAQLANMNPYPESVPINNLVRVEGTPLAHAEELDPLDFVRTVAVARITMPAARVRLSAGRQQMSDAVQALCFLAGANSIFYGEQLLTTGNPDVENDRALLDRLGMYPLRKSMSFIELQNELNERAAQGLLRRRRTLDSPQSPHIVVDGDAYLSFCSNDYLGLANHPRLIAALQQGAAQYGVGAGAAHLVSGHFEPHHRLEQELAAFVNKPAALLFSTGYMANLGAVQALAGKGDTVFADKLNHASLNDAMLLSRAAVKRYRHNDIVQLAQLLEQTQTGRKLIITDAVFSMDGDLAPLPELLELCERHDAWLLVDDAHGFGVLGAQGRGSLVHCGIASKRIIYMATLGKAAGVSGAFVAAEQVVIDTLVNHARSYVYTTATPPALSVALLGSLQLIGQGDALREHLRELIAQLRSGLAGLRWKLMPSDTAIQPLLIGDNRAVLALSEGLRERGIRVAAIRPPTVPQGTARLRITLSAAHSASDVARLVGELHELAC